MSGFLCMKDKYVKIYRTNPYTWKHTHFPSAAYSDVYFLIKKLFCDLSFFLHFSRWALSIIPTHSVITLFLDWGDGSIPYISPS